jgi:hypothetical protein
VRLRSRAGELLKLLGQVKKFVSGKIPTVTDNDLIRGFIQAIRLALTCSSETLGLPRLFSRSDD